MERITARGIVYAKCMTPFGLVHLITVHLNAWSNPKAEIARISQCLEVNKFIKELQLDLNTDMLLLGGDINVDVYANRQQLVNIENAIGFQCSFTLPESTEFSFNPSSNVLVGTDDHNEYACQDQKYEEFLDSGTCKNCPSQTLDSIANFNANQLQVINCRVLIVKNC